MSSKRWLKFESLEPRQMLSVSSGALLQSGGIDWAVAALPVTIGHTFAKATTATLASDGSGIQNATLVSPNVPDFYRFTSPVTGNMVVIESSDATAAFPALLSIFNSTQSLIPSIYPNPAGDLSSRVVFHVNAGSVYYAEAASASPTYGTYHLQFVMDTAGETFATATHIVLLPATSVGQAGSATQAGKIGYAGDTNVYSFTATVSGTMTVSLTAGQASALTSVLSVYSSNQSLLGQHIDTKISSVVVLPVTAGQTYYSVLSGFASTAGTYVLTISTLQVAPNPSTTVGHTFATATPIVLTPDPTFVPPASVTTPFTTVTIQPGTANFAAQVAAAEASNELIATQQTGTVDFPGDVDFFSFIAPVSGQMTLRQFSDSSKSSAIDSHLYIYNSSQTLIWQDDDADNSVNSRIVVTVSAGAKYYVEAAAHNASVGAYVLQFSTVPTTTDSPGTFATADSITPNVDGTSSTLGKIDFLGVPNANATLNVAGDSDMYSFVSPITSSLEFREIPTSGGLVPQLYVFLQTSASGVSPITTSPVTTTSPSTNSIGDVLFNVVQGSTYYIEAASNGLSAGGYDLVSVLPPIPPPPPLPPDGHFNITLNIVGGTAAEQAVIQAAAVRWETVITGDLPNVLYKGKWIDDIEIDLTFANLGDPNLLGGASVPADRRWLRPGSLLPFHGEIEFNTLSFPTLSAADQLAVATHEMGHSLGFSDTEWQFKGLESGNGTLDPRFTGATATAEYDAIFNTTATSVPLENSGFPGDGTYGTHWRKDTFGSELMTGYLNPLDSVNTGHPLSAITVGEMEDLGYTVNLAAADPFIAPFPASLKSSAPSSRSASRGMVAFLMSNGFNHGVSSASGVSNGSTSSDSTIDTKHRAVEQALLMYLE